MNEWFEFFNAYRVPAQHVASFLLAAACWLSGVFIATMVAPMYVVYWFQLGAVEASPYAPFYALVDVIAAVLFTAIALKANRNYPLWVAGFQLVAVGAHLVNALVEGVSHLALAILVIGPSYCQLLLLIGGFGRHAMRERRYGKYREWRLAAPTARGLSL